MQTWQMYFTRRHPQGGTSAGKRAQVQQCFGSPKQAADHLPDGSVAAFVSTYVLDILSDEDIEAVLCLADRFTYNLTF